MVRSPRRAETFGFHLNPFPLNCETQEGKDGWGCSPSVPTVAQCLASCKQSISIFNKYKTSPLCTSFPYTCIPSGLEPGAANGGRSEAPGFTAALRAKSLLSGMPEGGALWPWVSAPPHALVGRRTQRVGP